MSAKTTKARIAGAIAALEALRKLEHAAKENDSADTATEFYARRLANARALVAALGPMSPELEGAIAVLAEYAHMSINTGRPNLEPGGWIPLSATTEEARQAIAKKVDAEENEEGAIA